MLFIFFFFFNESGVVSLNMHLSSKWFCYGIHALLHTSAVPLSPLYSQFFSLYWSILSSIQTCCYFFHFRNMFKLNSSCLSNSLKFSYETSLHNDTDVLPSICLLFPISPFNYAFVPNKSPKLNLSELPACY